MEPPANGALEGPPSSDVAADAGSDGLFEGQASLSVDALISLVQDRNPTVHAMYSAWQAAAARYPQEVSLEDPMFEAMIAPRTFAGNSDVQDSWAIQASQKFPWAGKRWLRGEVANSNAYAAALDVDDVRLQIVLAARLAYADYASTEQLLELNTREAKLVDDARATASVRYETNEAPQQDVLQASVDLAEIGARRVELLRARQVARARINTLLHRHPRAPLPPSADLPKTAADIPDSEELLALALQSRPDLLSQGAKIAAEQNALCLALREFYPDVEFYARYDTMWFDPEQQFSVGLKTNLPVRRDRRWAAVAEAQARLARAQADYQARVDEIRYGVEAARQRVLETRNNAKLYSDEIAQLAEQNVASAAAGYVTGEVTFVALIEAQRQLIEVLRKAIDVTAEHQRQVAELERAVGTPLAQPPQPAGAGEPAALPPEP